MTDKDIELKEGKVIKDMTTGNKYRIYEVGKDFTDLVEILPYKLSFKTIANQTLMGHLIGSEFIFVDEPERVVDERHLSPDALKTYRERRAIITDINQIIEGDWKILSKHAIQSKIAEIREKYGYNPTTFRRIIIRYVTGGQTVFALTDKDWFNNSRKPYEYKVKTGRKSSVPQGKILDAYDFKAFDYGIKLYKDGVNHKKLTIRQSYYRLLYSFYNELTITGTGTSAKLVPDDQMPTEGQYRVYLNKKMSAKDKAVAKQGLRDVRNNRRLLNGDTVIHTGGPLGICEADAWDVGCLLVSDEHPDIVVGKPTVYAIIDDYSKSIVTVFVSFDRDSYIGLSGTMLSLAQDKKKLYAKYGLEIDDLWFPPAGYLPMRFRTDRGSDFTSDAFEDLCNRIGIIREEVTGGTGSLKGNIERLWGRIGELMTASLEKKGLIMHEPNEKPWKDAKFTIDEFTTMVLIAAAGINSQPCINYPLDAGMIASEVIPIPKNLWEYGVKNEGLQRQIKSIAQYAYDMMIDCKATISRSGIYFQGLYYKTDPDNPDPFIDRVRFEAGDTKIAFPIRIDPRRVDEVYYTNEGDATIRKAVLAINNRAAMDSYKNMTWQEYMAYKKKRNAIQAISRRQAEKQKAATYMTIEAYADQTAMRHDAALDATLPMDPNTGEIIANGTKGSGTRKDNLRIHHDEAKQKFRNDHSLYKETEETDDQKLPVEEPEEKPKKHKLDERLMNPQTPEDWVAVMKAYRNGEYE